MMMTRARRRETHARKKRENAPKKKTARRASARGFRHVATVRSTVYKAKPSYVFLVVDFCTSREM